MATLAKSVASMLPRWTNREVIESSGRDPLGLSRASDILIEYLLPGIISTTSRARYYSFYPWLIRDVALVSAEGKSRSFRQEFMSRDTAFGVSSYLGRVDKAPVVGSDAITLRHAEFQAEGQVNTKFKLLPSNDYGGLDQYYASSLHEVGLISPTATTERWELTPTGQTIAVAFEKSISDTPYFRRCLNRATEIDLEHLKESSASFSLDGLRRSEAAEERRLLIEAFFNPDKIAQHGARLRQETLGQMLHVMAQTGTIRDDQLDFDILYCPHYFGSIEINGKQRVYRPIAKWATTHALWRQFCAHQYLTAALEILLEAILNVLGGQPEGLSREILADALAASEVIEQLASYCGSSCAQPSKFASAFGVRGIPTPEDCETNLKEWSVESFRSEAAVLDAYGDGKMSQTATAIAVSMVLYGKWRASVDSSFGDLVSRFATELWLGNYLTVLDKWLTSSLTWHDAFKELIELIFARHETVMFQKRRLEACWMSFSNQRYFKEQDFRHTWRSSRHSNALQICYDLGLADFEPDDETWRLSRAGSKLLDRLLSALT